MVSLIIEHQDILHSHELRHHALKHLPFGLQCLKFFATALQERSASF